MRNIDRFLGVPLCWALAGVLKILPRKRPGLHPEEVNNILVLKFFGLGSIILSTVALSAMRSSFPKARITFLSLSSNEQLLRRIPMVDEVITLDCSGPPAFARDLLFCLRRLLQVKYEIVFDFEFFSKFSTFLSGFSRAPYRVGFALPTRWRSFHVTHPVPLSKARHVKDAFRSQVWALCKGTGGDNIIPPLILDYDAASLRQKVRLADEPLIVVNVNAGETSLDRRWPPARFADVISDLASRSDCCFVLTGRGSERAYVQAIIDRAACAERCCNAAGMLTIPELGALLQKCRLLSSNDSGPLHLAAALGVPTIALFGPESPVFYGPVGNKAINLYAGLPCSPCLNVYNAKVFHCPISVKCLRDISVDQVLTSAEVLLNERPQDVRLEEVA
jgi:ADP-heptose:LPS heptosyltransferase